MIASVTSVPSILACACASTMSIVRVHCQVRQLVRRGGTSSSLGRDCRARRDETGTFDLVGVASDGPAMGFEHVDLAPQGGLVAECVPDIGMLRDDRQGLLFASAADQHGNLAGRWRIESGQPVLDSRQAGGQGVEPLARGAEGIAVFVEVLLPPA